ncbi:hypothetical protein BS50DRAFT_656960 [Corynespora cassiicola Philippines]|uniref:Avirulence Effector AvrLm4-7 domain-containing protein n=1 Tax=Corynespora cassiicola Philippines TaxID=1448308 RepID=A0A2T2N2L6_CORCC|nr:hypothetical protein BS50DRAFT_656960 [Corynespora cassiicola Philippines]
MRSFVIPLWLAAFISFVIPTLACKQRFYNYQKEFANCNEGLMPGVKGRAERECASFRQAFVDLSAQANSQLGHSITSELKLVGEVLPDDNPNCIYYQCQVVAWRYREWQTEMNHRALPDFNGWTLKDRWYGKTVDCD